jgi:hypothetical protein
MAVRTIAAGGGNWNATATWMEGVVPVAGDNVFAAVTSGQLTVNVAAACTSIDFTNYTNTLTMNAILSVGGPVTLVAAMTIAGASVLKLTATGTLTSNGKTWPNGMTCTATSLATHTLIDDWTIGGTLTLTFGYLGAGVKDTFNGNNLYIGGGLAVQSTGNAGVNGTTTFILNGTGTWSAGTSSYVSNNLTFNTTGTITISGFVDQRGGTITYIAGTIVAAGGSRLTVSTAATTLNTSGMKWNQVRFYGVNITHTLTSDLNVGTLLLGISTHQTTINGSTINVTGFLLMLGASGGLTKGTTNIKITGGFITSSGMTLRSPLEIAGDVTIVSGNTLRYNTGTLTYTSGKVTTTGSTLLIELATTLINMDKIAWNIVNVTAGVTLTMNKFFSGSPKQKTTMRSVTSGTAYTITFQDTFEKTSKFVKVSECSLTRKGQLLMLTPNSDKGGNSGIRYINQSPNGIAKNSPSVVDPITYPSFGLVADPCFN